MVEGSCLQHPGSHATVKPHTWPTGWWTHQGQTESTSGPSLLHPPRVHLTSFMRWILPGLPHFHHLPLLCIIVHTNTVIHHHQSYHLCVFGMKNGVGLGMRLWNWRHGQAIDGIISMFQLPGHCLALEWSRGKTFLYLCQLTTLLAYHSCPWTWLALATYHALLSIAQSVFM